MTNRSDHTEIETRGDFPSDIRDLPDSQPSELVSLADAEEFDLGIAPIVKRLGDATCAHARLQRVGARANDAGTAGF